MCAWDSNPGPQYGRRRRNHGAMAATHHLLYLIRFLIGANIVYFGLNLKSESWSNQPSHGAL